jgi:hypothetical protein
MQHRLVTASEQRLEARRMDVTSLIGPFLQSGRSAVRGVHRDCPHWLRTAAEEDCVREAGVAFVRSSKDFGTLDCSG